MANGMVMTRCPVEKLETGEVGGTIVGDWKYHPEYGRHRKIWRKFPDGKKRVVGTAEITEVRKMQINQYGVMLDYNQTGQKAAELIAQICGYSDAEDMCIEVMPPDKNDWETYQCTLIKWENFKKVEE